MDALQNTKLGLKLPTDPRWVNLAEMDLGEILTDHAYCEQKAASACISLIQAYPHRTELVEELAPVVTEEWGHFRMVLTEMKKRHLSLGRQRRDEYVNALLAFQQKGLSPEQSLLEKLLTCALIEARSCERFKVLSENIKDNELAAFYRELMIIEANHYTTFINFAREDATDDDVEIRWEEYLAFEAEIIAQFGKKETVHG